MSIIHHKNIQGNKKRICDKYNIIICHLESLEFEWENYIYRKQLQDMIILEQFWSNIKNLAAGYC